MILIPQDAQMTRIVEAAHAALAEAGVTVQDLLDELPAAQAEVVERHYGAEFLQELRASVADVDDGLHE